ncbi:MAG: hypothetical protein WBW03_15645 [Silvibacterium sp.]
MRPAEGGEEIIEGVLVRETNGLQLETPAIAVAAEKILLTDDRVEQVTRSDALRVFVFIPTYWH